MYFWKLHKNLSKGKKIPYFIRIPILTISSWLFQGLLYMDPTERIFKILIDIILFIQIYIVLCNITNMITSLILGLLIAHTLNWILNGQIYVLLKNLKLTNTENNVFINYITDFKRRINKTNCILAVAIFGSLSKGTLNETSDLDVRIIRKNGLMNGMMACIFVLFERKRAFFGKFPLDIYVLDNMEGLSKMDEEPVVLFDPNYILKEMKDGTNCDTS